jgi:hypothetical protein
MPRDTGRRSLTGRGGEQAKGVRLAADGRASGWFEAQIVHTGRLPLFFFFIAFLVGFGFIRLSVRMIRAQVRWWPGNVTSGETHVHHVVFGVVFMVVGGVAGYAVPADSVAWRATSAALFGIGTALVLDEFALILHLRDVYWSSAGRVSIDAVFIAGGVTALLLVGVTPAGVQDVRNYLNLPGSGPTLASLLITLGLLFAFAAITLLKGKIWTGLFGLFVPLLFLVGALRLARPHSPWARWRYQKKPAKLERARRREQRFRDPVIRTKTRLQDLVAGYRPEQPVDGAPQNREEPLARLFQKQLVQPQAGLRGEDPAVARKPRLVQGSVVRLAPRGGTIAAVDLPDRSLVTDVGHDGVMVHDDFDARAVPNTGSPRRRRGMPACQHGRGEATAGGLAGKSTLEYRMVLRPDAAP